MEVSSGARGDLSLDDGGGDVDGGSFLCSPWKRVGIAHHGPHWHSAWQRPREVSGLGPKSQFLLIKCPPLYEEKLYKFFYGTQLTFNIQFSPLCLVYMCHFIVMFPFGYIQTNRVDVFTR